MDYTTSALAYHLAERPDVLIIGAGGGSDIGLALYHKSRQIVALEMNPQVIDLMTGPLASRGGRVYNAPGVTVLPAEARGYLASPGRTFDVIQLSAAGAFGASGAGLTAAQESYLHTVEAIEAMIDRLSDRGLVCITTRARRPPRDGLRVFDTAIAALKSKGMAPAEHLVMIRGMYTVTTVISRRRVGGALARAVRAFSKRRGFDLCFLPGLKAPSSQPYNELHRPYYFEGTGALLSADRHEYLDDYLFRVAATTDDRPYFFHFFKWRSLGIIARQLGQRSRNYVQVGYLMLLAALVQAAVAGAVLILLPLALRAGTLRATKGKAVAMGYFLMLGAGFMLLEMGLLQKLILYLAHPIYSAAAVISGFLIFAGVGSQISRLWPGGDRRVITVAGIVTICLACLLLVGLDAWLALTQAQPVWVRFMLAVATIAPLAAAMGHMFPTALRRIGQSSPVLVPWAWAVNGFASVSATVAAPLLAIHFGFSRLVLVAIACYALATLLGRRLAGKAE